MYNMREFFYILDGNWSVQHSMMDKTAYAVFSRKLSMKRHFTPVYALGYWRLLAFLLILAVLPLKPIEINPLKS